MATYKEIKGITVQTLDSDPVLNVNSWSSGGSMTTDRQRMGGDGTQTALIVAGGTTPSPSDQKALTETYNGTAFTEVNDLNTGRTDLALAGTTTAALAATGSAATGYGTFVESWNGSSWTETTENNTARQGLAAFGIQTAMVIAGGGEPPFSAKTEYWNGSSWTELNDLNTARQGLTNCGAGVYTAGMVAGGRKAHPSNPGQEAADTETWNATSWTEVNNLNEAKQLGSVFGTSTSAIYAGGADTATLAAVESWDGTNWTETSDLATARFNTSAGGTGNTSGVVVGGSPNAATEEWSLPPPTSTILTEGNIFLSGGTTLKGFGKAAGIPATAWSSGGNLNTGRRGGGGAGVSNTAALVWGGETIPPPTASYTNTESYNGTAWTELNDLNTKNADQSFSGTQTAAIGGGGDNPDVNALTESWNGSTWTEVADLNAARYNGGSIGFTASAHNFVGGLDAPVDQNNEFWNGTSWTEQNNLNTGRYNMFGFGNPASGFVGGGLEPSLSGKVESWDGTSWTETTDLNTARVACRGTGNTSSGIVFGGGAPSATGKTEFWNGSSWTEINDMSSGRATIMPNRSGGAVSAIAAGGPSSSALTEEWTTDNTLSTVTVS